MDGFDATTFGVLNASNYDAEHDPGTTDEAVELLWALSQGRPTLELAIGTGRVALPLAAKGLSIKGIDASQEMVDQLRAKPGGDRIDVIIGDMAQVSVPGPFGFSFLIFNTLFNVTSQQGQLDVFANVAQSLEPGGEFVVETIVPPLRDFSDNQSLLTRSLGFDAVELEAAVHDPVEQVIDMQRITITEQGARLKPLPFRYAWPAEIDLMAKLAGMQRVARWGDWDQRPFTADSHMHISVYRKDHQ